MLERALTSPNRMRVQYLNLIEVLLEQELADSAQIVQQGCRRRVLARPATGCYALMRPRCFSSSSNATSS